MQRLFQGQKSTVLSLFRVLYLLLFHFLEHECLGILCTQFQQTQLVTLEWDMDIFCKREVVGEERYKNLFSLPDNLVYFLNESGEDGLLLLLYVEFEVEVEGLYDASSVQTEEVAECISFFKNNGENKDFAEILQHHQGTLGE
jgi:hypothetical protein